MEQTSEQPSRHAEENQLPLGNLRPPTRPGDVGALGRFHVTRLLGHGGMGAVFHAHDPALGRDVALKIMLPHVAAREEGRRRFLREARAAAAVRSDHVVVIHDVGEDNGVPFLSMELLEGMTLGQWLASGNRPTLTQMLRIGREVALGLAAAHEKGLVHRDIKPGNIWLESRNGGRVKLLDFGLARPVEGESNLTNAGGLRGTAAYMAPEQARGEALDGRADLFSLGCVLYELATGSRAFPGKDLLTVLAQLAAHHPVPPPTLPPDVAGLISRLLSKPRDGRPARAADVAEELARAALVEASVTFHGEALGPPTREAETLEKPRHPWWPWVLGVALAGLAASLLVWFFWPPAPATSDAPPPAPPAKTNTLPAVAAPSIHLPPVPRDVLRQAFFAGGVPKELVAVIGPTALQHPRPVRSLAFSPDGKFLASTTGTRAGEPGRSVFVWDARAGALVHRLEAKTEAFSAVAYRPGKRELFALCNSGRVACWDRDTGKWLRAFPGVTGGPGHLAFSPDGKYLVVASSHGAGAGKALVRDVDGGTTTPLQAAPGLETDLSSLAFSGDGRVVAATCAKHLFVWEVGGKLQASIGLDEGHQGAACFYSPGGKGAATSLAFVGKGRLRLWGPGRKLLEDVKWKAGEQGRPQIAAHGDALAYTRGEREAVIRRPGNKLVNLRNTTAFDGGLAFSPDGTRLAAAVAPAGVVIFDASTGEPLLPGNPVLSAAFHPTEDAIAVGRGDGRLELVSLKDGRLLVSGQGPRPAVALAYRADGEYLLAGADTTPLSLHGGRDLKRLRTFPGEKGAFGKDDSVLTLTGTRVAQYRCDNGRPGKTTALAGAGQMNLDLGPDGAFVVGHLGAKFLRVWSLPDGQFRDLAPKGVQIPAPQTIASMACSLDGQEFAVVYETGRVYRLDQATGAPKGLLNTVVVTGREEGDGTPAHAAYALDGSLAGATCGGLVMIWRPQAGAVGLRLGQNAGQGIRFCPVPCDAPRVSWSPDGTRLLVRTYSGVVLVFKP